MLSDLAHIQFSNINIRGFTLPIITIFIGDFYSIKSQSVFFII